MDDLTQSLRLSNDLSICNKYMYHDRYKLWCDLPTDHEGPHEAYLGYNTYESWEDTVADESYSLRIQLKNALDENKFLKDELAEDELTMWANENAQMRSDINLFINAITYLLGKKEPTEDLAELMNKYRKNDHE